MISNPRTQLCPPTSLLTLHPPRTPSCQFMWNVLAPHLPLCSFLYKERPSLWSRPLGCSDTALCSFIPSTFDYPPPATPGWPLSLLPQITSKSPLPSLLSLFLGLLLPRHAFTNAQCRQSQSSSPVPASARLHTGSTNSSCSLMIFTSLVVPYSINSTIMDLVIQAQNHRVLVDYPLPLSNLPLSLTKFLWFCLCNFSKLYTYLNFLSC